MITIARMCPRGAAVGGSCVFSMPLSDTFFSCADSKLSTHCPGHGPDVECCIESDPSFTPAAPLENGYDFAEIDSNEYIR